MIPRRTFLAASVTATAATALVGCTPAPAVEQPTAEQYEYFPHETSVILTPQSDGTWQAEHHVIFDAGAGVNEPLTLAQPYQESLGLVTGGVASLQPQVTNPTASEITTGTPVQLAATVTDPTRYASLWHLGESWSAGRHRVTAAYSVTNVWVLVEGQARLVITHPGLTPWWYGGSGATKRRLQVNTDNQIWRDRGDGSPPVAVDPTALEPTLEGDYLFLRPTNISAEPIPVTVQ